ncbi:MULTISPECIES: MarR family winged helix-turn-helix transcriptional regulator [unclassified Streptomyces]|uniref:MarR family winged helix-turn-helix transcriptional regulator n=1 Tax=unclassified Streptomyces TaxID=2593676 RepID=UPI003D8D4160
MKEHPRREDVETAMETDTRGRHSAEPPSPTDGDDSPDAGQSIDRELLDWWMLVMQGFHATQEALVSEVAERFHLGRGLADVLVRLLAASQHRMPMSRLAQETGMSSGGFTKLADRLDAAHLARRVACEADRRVTYLELTGHGADTAQAISRALTQILRARLLTPLGRDGVAQLADAMRELRDTNDPGK